MNCRECGHPYPDRANYCQNDGTLLSRSTIKLKANEQAQFCPDCGSQALPGQFYCISCGHSLTKYSKEKGLPLPIIDSGSIKNTASVLKNKATTFNLSALSLDYFKKALVPVIATFVILLVLGFTTLSYVDDIMNDILGGQLDEMTSDFDEIIYSLKNETTEELPELDKLFGITDIIMLSNMQDSTLKIETTGGENEDYYSAKGSIDFEHGSLVYLIFSFVSLFIGGIIMGVKNKDSRRIQVTLSFAAIYAVILSIISLFAGYSYKNSFNLDDVNVTFKLVNDYSFFSSLFWGFVLAFTISGLGLLLTINYRKITGNLRLFSPYGEAVHQAFSTVVRGGLVIFIFIFITFYNKVEELKQMFMFNPLPISLDQLFEKSLMFVTTISIQFSNYLWNLLHFTPLTFSTGEGLEKNEITYSAFGGFKAVGSNNDMILDTLGYMISNLEVDDYLKIAYLLPLVLFVWAGYKIAQGPGGKVITKVAVFSVTYALLMAILASFSDLGLSMEYIETDEMDVIMAMNFGFPVFKLFIGSLLFSFAGAYGGTRIRTLGRKA